MAKVLFIVNPAAGNGNGAKAGEAIKKSFVSGSDNYEIYVTTGCKDSINYLTSQKNRKFEKIIAVGGDGTINEVVNGIISAGYDTSLGVIPVGSGNDLVKMIPTPGDLIESVQYNLANTGGKQIDAGKLTYKKSDNSEHQRYFINSVGIGFDAKIAYHKEQNHRFPGITAYIVSLIKAIKDYKPINAEIRSDSFNTSGDFLLMTAGNGKTSGGGFYLNPDAEIDDGKLDFTTVEFVGKTKLFYKLPLALFNKLKKVKEVKFYTFNYLEIKLAEPYYIHADGEMLSDDVVELKLEILKSAIKII